MNSAAAGLLDELRTASFGQSSGPAIRRLADQLEAAFRTEEEQKSRVHLRMVKMGNELASVKTELEELLEKLAVAEEKIRLLICHRFGKSKETWSDAEKIQGVLFPELEDLLAQVLVEDESVQQEAAVPVPAASVHKPRGKRKPLPESFERVIRRIELPENERQCPACGKTLEKIGEDTSERLQVIPQRFYVEVTIRDRMACTCGCSGVRQAKAPESVAPKSIVGESLAAQIVTAKFCDGIPFCRQSSVLSKRYEVDISDQTMARTTKAVATIFAPLAGMIQEGLMQCPVVCGDETRLRVLHEDGKQKEGLSWMWVLVGEHEGRRYVRFRYDPGRGNDAGTALLAGYTGTVVADGYGVYASLEKELKYKRAACLAHVRRRFMETLKANPKNKDAQTAMAMIQSLYQIEKTLASTTDQKRLEERQELAKPIFERFRAWIVEKSEQVRPKGLLGIAVNYALKLLPNLAVYLEDGRVPIDNNRALSSGFRNPQCFSKS